MAKNNKIIDHDHVLKVTTTQARPVYLRRSTLISSTNKLTNTSLKLSRSKTLAKNLFLGVPLVVNKWLPENKSSDLTASLGYFGKVIEILVNDDMPVMVNIDQYLGHIGDFEINIKNISKKEIWYNAEFTGSGSIFLHIPSGYDMKNIGSTDMFLDKNYVSAIWGQYEICGEDLDLKSWIKSGETDSVIISGPCTLIIAKTLKEPKSGSGLFGSLIDIFS